MLIIVGFQIETPDCPLHKSIGQQRKQYPATETSDNFTFSEIEPQATQSMACTCTNGIRHLFDLARRQFVLTPACHRQFRALHFCVVVKEC